MKLTEEQYKQACRDYERGYTMAADYVYDGIAEYTPSDLMLMSWDDELEKAFDIKSEHMKFGIEDFLYDLEAMRHSQNVHSVRLS